jgi:hypothetical protein
MSHFFQVIAVLALAGAADCGNVLFYMPFISESVKITFMPVVKELASRGHGVTVVTPFPDKTVEQPNVRQITFDSSFMHAAIRQVVCKTCMQLIFYPARLKNTALVVCARSGHRNPPKSRRSGFESRQCIWK